jgi:hypothetical protein
MSEPRNAAIIVCEMIQLIPHEKNDFKDALKRFLYDDLAYRSPEMLTHIYTWTKYTELMKKYLPETKEDWEHKCANLFNNRGNPRFPL